MKKVSRRAILALLLAGVLLTGSVFFVLRYFTRGDDWVTFPGSPHVYKNGVLRSGTVTDAEGELLLTLSGERTYAADATVRKTTLHLLGDRSGNIYAPILDRYAPQFAGYDSFSGIYFAGKTPENMTLTIRSSVQKAAYEALNGRKGTVAVYNYVNGEILCSVSAPAYDPDNIPDIENDKTGQYDGIYVNRFANSVYVPGSIFKLVTAACALDTYGEDILTRKFSCDGALEVSEDVVICTGNHGEITLKEALAKSCNCAFGQLSMELGAETIQNYVNQMGLTEIYDADGLQTQAGRFDLTDARDVEVAWSGIGQHTVMVNPYSFLRFVGAIAGGGSAAEPYFVKNIGNYQAKTGTFELEISENTTKILSDFMENNVQTVYGTEYFPKLPVCAKSGTAEVGENQTPHATFAGFVRDLRYPFAFIVIVENGGSGSSVCSPIAGKVLSACIKSMDSVGN